MGNPQVMGSAVMPDGRMIDVGRAGGKKKGREMAKGFAGCEKGERAPRFSVCVVGQRPDLDLGWSCGYADGFGKW